MAMTEIEIDAPKAANAADELRPPVVVESADFGQVRSGWESLSSVVPSPMETWGWSAAAASSLANEQQPRLVVVEHDGSIRAVAPLALSHRFPLSRLEMIGMEVLNEPGDFAFADREALEAVVRRAIRFGRPILLGRLPAESPTIDLFRRLSKRRGKVILRERPSYPFITLDESWLEPERHMSSRRRSDFRRARRRADDRGEVRAEIIAPTPHQLDSLLDAAFAVEARSWKGTAGTALAHDPVRGGHLRRFGVWASHAGILRICLLHIGESIAAMQIAAEHNSAFWLLKIGFDPAFANCSPGNLLLAESIRYSVMRKLRSVEFLGTVEPWTQVWTDRERKCVSLRYYPFNFRGACGFLVDAGGKLLGRAKSGRRDGLTAARSDESGEYSRNEETA